MLPNSLQRLPALAHGQTAEDNVRLTPADTFTSPSLDTPPAAARIFRGPYPALALPRDLDGLRTLASSRHRSAPLAGVPRSPRAGLPAASCAHLLAHPHECPASGRRRAPGSRRRTASAAWRLRTGARRVSYVSAEVSLPTSWHTEARPRNRPPRWGRRRRAPTRGSWPPREPTHRARSHAAPRLSRSGSTSRETRLSASPPAQTAGLARPRPSAEGALPGHGAGNGSAASRL